MSQKYSVQVAEGEMDEDDEELEPQPAQEKPKEVVQSTQEDKSKAVPVSIDKLKNIEEMSNYIIEYKQEDLQKLENTADNILGGQDGLLKEIEKTKLEFYSAEFIDIHDTFLLMPEYLKKIKEIKRIMTALKDKAEKSNKEVAPK